MRFSLFVCSSLLIHKQQLWLGEKYKMKQRATVEIVKTKFQCAFLRWSFFVAGFFFSLSTDVVYVFDCSFGIHDLLQSFSFVSFRIHNEKLLSCFPPFVCVLLHIRTNGEYFRCFVTLCLLQCVYFYLCFVSKIHIYRKSSIPSKSLRTTIIYIFSKIIWPNCLVFLHLLFNWLMRTLFKWS